MVRGIKFPISLFRRTEGLTKSYPNTKPPSLVSSPIPTGHVSSRSSQRSHAAAPGNSMTSDYVAHHSKGFAQPPRHDTSALSASSKAPTARPHGYMTEQQTYVPGRDSSEARMGSPSHGRQAPVRSMNETNSYASAEQVAEEKGESGRSNRSASKMKGLYGREYAENDLVDTSELYGDELADMPARHQSSRAVGPEIEFNQVILEDINDVYYGREHLRPTDMSQ